MHDTATIRPIIAELRAAASRTETAFLSAGTALEAAIGILTRLAGAFDTLLAELADNRLHQALAALPQVGTRIAALGSGADEATGLDRMLALTSVIAGRIVQMNRSVAAIDSLSINTRIAAAGIHAAGVDFGAFAGEITRTVKLTKASLAQFATELQHVRERVGAARAGRQAFATRRQEAVRTIPARLSATVAGLVHHHRAATEASTAVRERSDRVRAQIGDAILALQVGDSTRQRLEHAEAALTLAAGPPLLPAAEQAALAGITCRLQSAQLADAAREYERDVGQIVAALGNLATEMRALRQLGSATYGSGGNGIMAELESHVAAALALFQDFATARAEAASVARAVAGATTSLCLHLKRVQSLEADIRIMGLNTTFKCARIGREGLALSLIAQELRTHANAFAKEAATLMGEVDHVTAVAGTLTDGEAEVAGDLLAEASNAMAGSLATLRQLGDGLGEALTGLEDDSLRVESLLAETVGRLGASDTIGRALRAAPAALDQDAPDTVAALTPAIEDLLQRMARGYTMASERIVHERVLGQPATATAAGAAALEDMLF